ncbi:MAG: peptidoglycan-binding protein, partial [Clostridia bacterium]|nr:peptidoglycan-binding protein [Clostridia bacterium]
MTGEDVKTVQNSLKTLGYSVNVNGKYDEATRDVVKGFQKANGLTVDGKCGSGTWKAIEKAVKAAASETAVKGVSVTKSATLKITRQPANVTVALGGKVSFTVKAEGTGLTYQWQLSDDNGKTWRNSSVKKADY